MPPRGTLLLLLVEQAYFYDWWGLAWGSLWPFLSILGLLMAQPGGGSVTLVSVQWGPPGAVERSLLCPMGSVTGEEGCVTAKPHPCPDA